MCLQCADVLKTGFEGNAPLQRVMLSNHMEAEAGADFYGDLNLRAVGKDPI